MSVAGEYQSDAFVGEKGFQRPSSPSVDRQQQPPLVPGMVHQQDPEFFVPKRSERRCYARELTLERADGAKPLVASGSDVGIRIHTDDPKSGRLSTNGRCPDFCSRLGPLLG